MLAALGVLIGFVLAQGVAFALLRPGPIEGGAITQSLALTLIGVQLVGIAAVALAVALGLTTPAKLGLVGSASGSWWRGLRLLAPVGLLVIAPTLLVSALGAGSDPVLARGLSPSLALVLVVLAVLISINEELWFRGLMVERLERARKPVLTLVAATLLFGLPHVAATSASWLNAAAVTLAVAIPFAVVRMRVRSLWPLIAWHALIDAWAFLHTASVVPTGNPSAAQAAGALLLPSAIAIGYVAWWRRGAPTR